MRTRPCSRCLRSGHHLENAEGDYAGAEARLRGGARRWPSASATFPPRSSFTPRSRSSPSTAATGRRSARANDISAELAEHEGLIGKLCLPYTLRGLLCWRDGEWDASAQLFLRARELAEQVGWSEVAFNALLGLAVTQRDRGELVDAASTVTQALEVCERAGLAGQSIQAMSMRALMLALVGDEEPAEQAAEQAAELATRIHYPVGEAAMLEARGMTCELPEAFDLLRRGHAAWEQLGRPLDAARCELLLGQRLREHDPAAASEALASAAAACDRLGVGHLAEQARELMVA